MNWYAQAKKLREERAKAVKTAEDILSAAEKEKRDLTPEESEQFKTIHGEVDKLLEKIEQTERQGKANDALESAVNPVKPGGSESDTDADKAKAGYRDAFWKYARSGLADMEPEARALIQKHFRAQATSPDSAGGATIPEDFRRAIEVALKRFGGMRQAATVFTSTSGADLPWPTSNDTANEGELLGENVQAAEQDIVFSSITLGAFTYSSKVIRVSLQLLQDSAFNLETFLSDRFGERLGRITNRHYTTGTGTGQPNGVVTASVAGFTAANAAAIVHDDLLELKHSVDPAYRVGPKVGWMFNDNTLLQIKQLKDSDGRPLWQAGIAVGTPDRIDGDLFTINQDIASIATTAKSVLYGDFSKYVIRDVLTVQMLRLVERFADFLQVGFLAFMRTDADLIDAGTNPIKHLVHP